MLRRPLLAIFALATVAGCSGGFATDDAPALGEPTGRSEDALAATFGLVPLPIKMQFNNRDPQKDGAGKVIPWWSGSLPDLIAADAWAACSQGMSSVLSEADGYLRHLVTKMSQDGTCVSPVLCDPW